MKYIKASAYMVDFENEDIYTATSGEINAAYDTLFSLFGEGMTKERLDELIAAGGWNGIGGIVDALNDGYINNYHQVHNENQILHKHELICHQDGGG